MLDTQTLPEVDLKRLTTSVGLLGTSLDGVPVSTVSLRGSPVMDYPDTLVQSTSLRVKPITDHLHTLDLTMILRS